MSDSPPRFQVIGTSGVPTIAVHTDASVTQPILTIEYSNTEHVVTVFDEAHVPIWKGTAVELRLDLARLHRLDTHPGDT